MGGEIVTPLFGKSHEPDERPSSGEVIFACCLFLFVLAALYIADLLKLVTP